MPSFQRPRLTPWPHVGLSASLCAGHWVQSVLGDLGWPWGTARCSLGQSPEKAVSRGDKSFSPQSGSWQHGGAHRTTCFLIRFLEAASPGGQKPVRERSVGKLQPSTVTDLEATTMFFVSLTSADPLPIKVWDSGPHPT